MHTYIHTYVCVYIYIYIYIHNTIYTHARPHIGAACSSSSFRVMSDFLGSPGVKNGTFVRNFIDKIDHFLEGLFFEILEGARRDTRVEGPWDDTMELEMT